MMSSTTPEEDFREVREYRKLGEWGRLTAYESLGLDEDSHPIRIFQSNGDLALAAPSDVLREIAEAAEKGK